MLLRMGMFLLALFSLASSASATVVNIDFTAHVYATSGDGLGYRDGDSFSGSFVLNTAYAAGSTVNDPDQVSLYGPVFSPFIQTSFVKNPFVDYWDYLTIYNDSAVFGDTISITKAIDGRDFTIELLGISFHYLNLDWISDLDLKNINLVQSEGGYSNGMFARFDFSKDREITDSARFWLDTLTITSAPVSVPEPAPLVLLSIVLAGLVVRRRFI